MSISPIYSPPPSNAPDPSDVTKLITVAVTVLTLRLRYAKSSAKKVFTLEDEVPVLSATVGTPLLSILKILLISFIIAFSLSFPSLYVKRFTTGFSTSTSDFAIILPVTFVNCVNTTTSRNDNALAARVVIVHATASSNSSSIIS